MLLTSKSYVIVIGLEFSNASDTVCHSCLLKSFLSSTYLDVLITDWILDHLQDHMHCTIYNGHQLDMCALSASIIQGEGSDIGLRCVVCVIVAKRRTCVRITCLAIVSWLVVAHFSDGDPCGPRSDASAMCHVRTAPTVTVPSLPPARAHGTSSRSAYATPGYR